jgi:hypothetical protein
VKNQELFDYLSEKYAESREDAPDTGDHDEIASFCDFARKHFATNTPVHMGFEETGMGLQLQDGTHLVFIEQRAQTEANPGNAVPVTAPTASATGMTSIRTTDDSVAITPGGLPRE